MVVAQTSLLAYAEIRDSLGAKQLQVYEALKNIEPASNWDVAEFLRWPINQVTGRMNELCYRGLVQVEVIGMSKFGKKEKRWSTRDLGDAKLGRIAKEYGETKGEG
jgi:predicted ArsR family transcriptional regulator